MSEVKDTIEEEWFYEVNGGRVGPVGSATVRSLLTQGVISSTTLVWNSNLGREWQPLHQTTLFSVTAITPPALPSESIKNSFALFLAFLPIIETLGTRFVSDSLPDLPPLTATLTFFVIGIALALFDAKRIERSGRVRNEIRLKRWCWLTPVYLFRRARVVQEPYKFFSVWVFGLIAAFYLSNTAFVSKTYFGFGDPSCRSLSIQNIVKEVFPQIEIIKLKKVSVARLTNISEIENFPGLRTCDATVKGTDGSDYSIRYKVIETEKQKTVRVFLL